MPGTMEMIMEIERPLLDILACPIDKQGLLYFDDEAIFYNPRLRRIYRMAENYPILLADRAEPVPQHEHERLLKRAGHGDAVGTSGLAAHGLDPGQPPEGRPEMP
jgi:uncharacterized protein YbaR (Trm112 family)